MYLTQKGCISPFNCSTASTLSQSRHKMNSLNIGRHSLETEISICRLRCSKILKRPSKSHYEILSRSQSSAISVNPQGSASPFKFSNSATSSAATSGCPTSSPTPPHSWRENVYVAFWKLTLTLPNAQIQVLERRAYQCYH
jgi:hypothetical protein